MSDKPQLYHAGDLKILIWAYLDSFGPLEASRGQTKHTMVGNKVVYAILEQVGSVQQAQESHFTIISRWDIPKTVIWAHVGL